MRSSAAAPAWPSGHHLKALQVTRGREGLGRLESGEGEGDIPRRILLNTSEQGLSRLQSLPRAIIQMVILLSTLCLVAYRPLVAQHSLQRAVLLR